MAPANKALSFTSPMEGEALLLPALECLHTLYPGVYTRGTTAPTPPGWEGGELVLDIGAHTHTGAAGADIFLGGR